MTAFSEQSSASARQRKPAASGDQVPLRQHRSDDLNTEPGRGTENISLFLVLVQPTGFCREQRAGQ